MEDITSSKKSNISGLSFRDIASNVNEYSSSGDQYEGFLFVNDEIESGPFIKYIRSKYIAILKYGMNSKGILAFIISLWGFLYSRVRVIWVLISVLFDIALDSVDVVKNGFVKKMFWGRGNFLLSALQTILSVVIFILIISYLYRQPVVIIASDDKLESIGVAESDTMIVNASLNTLVPKGRPRRNYVEYTVKRGDTISSIAKEASVNGVVVSSQTILWANGLKESDYLKLGQTLNIPPRDGVLVTIKKGDTLESLAKKYSADAADIVDFNWLESPFTLALGSDLFIPNGELPAEPKPVYASGPVSSYKTSTSITYKATPADPKVGRFLRVPVGGSYAMSRGFFSGHYGIDYYPTKGQPSVIAASGGQVISAGWGNWGSNYGGYGYYVHIDHGNGYTTLYGHMAKLYVRSGQTVTKGQALGQIGATGVAYGVHVHFELRRGAGLSGRMNPAPYMQ